MDTAKYARKLADYLADLPQWIDLQSMVQGSGYCHIGALFTDVVLQAGLNYNSVVKPRVWRVIINYPDALTVTDFKKVIEKDGLEAVINWKHPVKLKRFEILLEYVSSNNVESCLDLISFLIQEKKRKNFLLLDGFGPKSLDYLLKLLCVDNVAIDRHVYSFLKLAEIEIKGYQEAKRVVEYAADFLDVSRSALDKFIWDYMSQKKYRNMVHISQSQLAFPEHATLTQR